MYPNRQPYFEAEPIFLIWLGSSFLTRAKASAEMLILPGFNASKVDAKHYQTAHCMI
jgi:hypothetical protein